MFNTWEDFFISLKNKEYFNNLSNFIDKEYESYVCYPPKDKIFNAFELTEKNNVKVVVIGQDPYHEKNQAMGLAFSVPNNVKIPPSLKNILKELENEYGLFFSTGGDLTYLAKQGVLLLNAILTVREGEPLSHNIKEYHLLLNEIISEIEKDDSPIVYLLWGGPARKLKSKINNPRHLVLEANHPSPLSANRGGWFGCDHFKKANQFLEENNLSPIDWINVL